MIALILILFIITLLCLWIKHHYSYWARHNVKYIKPLPILGNFSELLKKGFNGVLWDLYQKSTEPLEGIYMVNRPTLLLRDLDLIKQVMIKDFNLFSNRAVSVDPHHDPLGADNIFFVRNPKWRQIRNKLSPVFSSGKVKQMYPLMIHVGKQLEEYASNLNNSDSIEIKEICIRYTSDFFASIAFGLNANSLKDPNSEFFKKNMEFFRLTLSRALDFAMVLLTPVLASLFGARLFDASASKFLRDTVGFAMEDREKTGNIRNDLIDTLINIRNTATESYEKEFDFLVAQAGFFEMAGFETSSSTMTFALFELAHHPEEQMKLRAEICEAFEELNDGTINYEKLQELPYLDQVISETLRKYPIIGFLDRVYTPEAGSKTEYTFAPHSDFVLPSGCSLYVSSFGIHRDERYWPSPDDWNPERFSASNRSNINWNAYLPFGIGPRNCVGMRIGLLQSKLGLAYLLKNHKVVKSAETPKTVKFSPRTPLLIAEGGIKVSLEKVQ